MALPPSFLEELRARTPLPTLIGRRVKLTRSSRDWKGCCPFHNEKSPSFYVYADHYHCFGCGAHGDAISFVMQTQNAGFMEAVEQLAAEAGLDVPKPSPEAAAAEKRRADLHEVLEAAATLYQRLLAAPEGQAARDYLRKRGLTEETIRRFGLGFSGGRRGELAAELARAGIDQPRLVEAGLMKRGEDGRFADFFFGRVMFPIRDARGRMISFGGRIMGDGQPKYLNGPETALFSKRRNLYGLDIARAILASRRRARAEAPRQGLVVVEGYMDVIALAQAGFAAVAPLGTAITAEQIETLWQYEERPVFCFDGDAAGARAGLRAVALALPLLTAERSIGVVSLPPGEDPDSLLLRHGREGMAEALARDALVPALYGLLKREVGPTSPETWAKLDRRLGEIARAIPDRALSSSYLRALRDLFYADQRAARGQRFVTRGPGGRVGPAPPPIVPTGPRPVATEDRQVAERARVLFAILLTHPVLLPDLEEPLSNLDLPEEFSRLRDALFAWLDDHPQLDRAALNGHLRSLGYDAVLSSVLGSRPLPACTMPDAAPADAASHWWQIYGFMRGPHIEADVRAAQRACEVDFSETNQRRLIALAASWERIRRGESETGL
ncbi:DNA primase [Acidisoma sp. C75]